MTTTSRSPLPFIGLSACVLFAAAGARAEDSKAAADTDERSRVSLSVEQAPLTYRSRSLSGSVESKETSIAYNPTLLAVGADVRVVAGLEVGLGVTYLASWTHSATGFSDGSSVTTTITQSGFGTTPRAGYRIPLDADIAVVPRLGVRLMRTTYDTSTKSTGVGVLAGNQKLRGSSTSAMAGALLQFNLAESIYAELGPEVSVLLGSSTEQELDGRSTTVPGFAHALEVGLVLGAGARF